MSKSDELRAKNKRVKGAQQEGNPNSRSTANVRTAPVRCTVDLPPTEHAALKRWELEAAISTGSAEVTNQAVLRALVGRLLADEELAESVRQDLSNS